jgi:hypothetical protein
MNSIQEIINWSEVWAPLIPLTFFLILRPKTAWTKPVFYFLVITLFFSICLDVMWKRRTLGLNDWFEKNLWWWWDIDRATGKKALKNNIFYNLNSFARLIFFSAFFTYFYPVFKKIHRYVPWIFLALMIVNFIFHESIKDFSSIEHAVEAAILLTCCLIYIYKATLDDTVPSLSSQPQFWLITGLTLYTAINFFIFLFYKYLMASLRFKKYANDVWNVHNISFIILCVLTAVSFYKAKKWIKTSPY